MYDIVNQYGPSYLRFLNTREKNAYKPKLGNSLKCCVASHSKREGSIPYREMLWNSLPTEIKASESNAIFSCGKCMTPT